MAQLTQISTSTLSNQNISSALLVHTFTNTTRLRKIYIDVFANQIAGNGDYVVYVTRQRSGAGSAYEMGARTTVPVPSGVTQQGFPTIALMVGATDVIKVYLTGLAGDTTTPDIITDVTEEFINADSSGNVSLTATGLDAITATRPSTIATTFPQMLVLLYYRFFGKATLTDSSLKTYAANGTTVVTTQNVSDDSTTQTQGEAS